LQEHHYRNRKVANTEGPLYRAPERNASDLLSKNSSAH